MTLARATYGIVEGENPPRVHRFGTLAGRSCCGKKIVVTDADTSSLVACQRCNALDNARRSGIPDWFEMNP
ncbi:MAG: hypothetical protein QOG65_1207 [Actinomycetota bacterium]|jgi:hypothetical protein|nr:hypothetical protein [Actinomycetota bacterium]